MALAAAINLTGLFLLYKALAMGSKISCGPKYFHGIIPCYPSAGHHPYAFQTTPNHDLPF
jgi:hypothetical protein